MAYLHEKDIFHRNLKSSNGKHAVCIYVYCTMHAGDERVCFCM